jgi:predicted hydrocarbon binding protein
MGRLEESVTVIVEDNFFAAAGKKKWERPRCFLISGLLAGIAEGLLGEGHSCMETKCMAAGSPHCEFLITRRSKYID